MRRVGFLKKQTEIAPHLICSCVSVQQLHAQHWGHWHRGAQGSVQKENVGPGLWSYEGMVTLSVKMCLNVFQGVMWTIQTLAATQGSVQKDLPTTGHVRLAEVKKDFNGKERKIGGSLQYAVDCLLS